MHLTIALILTTFVLVQKSLAHGTGAPSCTLNPGHGSNKGTGDGGFSIKAICLTKGQMAVSVEGGNKPYEGFVIKPAGGGGKFVSNRVHKVLENGRCLTHSNSQVKNKAYGTEAKGIFKTTQSSVYFDATIVVHYNEWYKVKNAGPFYNDC